MSHTIPPVNVLPQRGEGLRKKVIRLQDGEILALRSVREGDEPALRHFFQSLSAETLFLRFGQWRLTLSRDRLARLCRMEGEGDQAFLAVLGGDEGAIVGEVRLNVLSAPDSAELSFVVADAWQGRGIGDVLMVFVLEVAKEIGLKTLVMEIMKKNMRMICFALKYNFHHRPGDGEDDMEELRLEMGEGPGAYSFTRSAWEGGIAAGTR